MTDNTKINKIIERLEKFERPFPRVALQNAIEEKEAITPHLLQDLKESTLGIERIYNDSDYMLYFYAIFLLAQFREQKAFPLLIDFFSTDAEMIDEVLGDFVTEGVSRALASTYDGNLALLKGLIENEEVNEYVRANAKDSLAILHLEGILTREEVIEYYRSLFVNKTFGDNGFLYGSLASVCSKLSADELKIEIEDAFEAELIEPSFIDLNWFHESLKVSRDDAFQELKKDKFFTPIDDTIKELENWAMFEEDKPVTQTTQKATKTIKATRKIGRNEPCPCGSGKKYKKCCIKKGIY